MSMHKQLWLGTCVLLTLLFAGSCLVYNLFTRDFLEQQLSQEAAHNAAVLAAYFAAAPAAGDSPPPALPAGFDTRPFRSIEIADPVGNVQTLHRHGNIDQRAPAWFIQLFPIAPEPGITPLRPAQQPPRTLIMRMQSDTAYAILWRTTLEQALFFTICMVIAVPLGDALLRRSLVPLEQLAEQAEAFGRGQFLRLPAPATPEFRPLGAALNHLSGNIRARTSRRLQVIHRKPSGNALDSGSAPLVRDDFMAALKSELFGGDRRSQGVLCIVHVSGLATLNRQYGRQAIDHLLTALGDSLVRVGRQDRGWVTGRLNGSEFAVLAPHARSPMDVAKEAQAALRDVLHNRKMADATELPTAATLYDPGEQTADIMTRLDGAMSGALADRDSSIHVAEKGSINMSPSVREQMERWRSVFDEAFSQLNFSLTTYPVTWMAGELLHYEAPARLNWRERELTASQFLPWINRLQRAEQLDRQVVELAIRKIESSGKPICINLSSAALTDATFLPWLLQRMMAHETVPPLLWIEFPEPAVYLNLPAFRAVCERVRELGIRVGIEHAGRRASDIGLVSDIGLDYIKIDTQYIRDIDQNNANQTIIRALAAIGNSSGIMMIAEGVSSEAEWRTLTRLGVDGVTGPAVTARA